MESKKDKNGSEINDVDDENFLDIESSEEKGPFKKINNWTNAAPKLINNRNNNTT